MGVSENRLNPIVPNGFADHYPFFKWLFHWEYSQHFQTKDANHVQQVATKYRRSSEKFTRHWSVFQLLEPTDCCGVAGPMEATAMAQKNIPT